MRGRRLVLLGALGALRGRRLVLLSALGAVRGRRLVLLTALGAALALPPAAMAQGTETNPLSPGFPQPSVPVPTTTVAPTPTVTTTATAGSGSGFSGSSAILIAIGAMVVLGGISLYIWRDARRRAPTRHHAPLGPDEGRRKGSKAPAKSRKLSPAERRRRKRGRAR